MFNLLFASCSNSFIQLIVVRLVLIPDYFSITVNLIENSVPLFLFSSSSPSNWSTREVTSCIPRLSRSSISRSSGIPTPLSETGQIKNGTLTVFVFAFFYAVYAFLGFFPAKFDSDFSFIFSYKCMFKGVGNEFINNHS